GEATTREVLEEESRIIQFAREGKGTMRPLGGAGVGAAAGYRAPYLGLEDRNVSINTSAASTVKIPVPLESHAGASGGQQPLFNTATLSDEQQAVCKHIW